jgi:hypothetical protein
MPRLLDMSLYAVFTSQNGKGQRNGSIIHRMGRGGGTRGTGSGADIGATLRELSCKKMSQSLVRRGEAEKGKSASSKITC